MSQGPSVPLPETDVGTPMPYFTSGQPTIICIQATGESDDHHGDIEWFLEQCGPQNGHEYWGAVAQGEQGDRYIMLCPRFWTSPALNREALSRDCPKVRLNTLTPYGDELAQSMQHILVEEMAHLYAFICTGSTGARNMQSTMQQISLMRMSSPPVRIGLTIILVESPVLRERVANGVTRTDDSIAISHPSKLYKLAQHEPSPR